MLGSLVHAGWRRCHTGEDRGRGANSSAATIPRVTEVRTAHTADLDPAVLAAARELLEDVFAGDFSEDDWEHALGGMHALAWDGSELVAHASVVQRRLLHGGRALRGGYVDIGRETRSSPASYDRAAEDRLWDVAEELCAAGAVTP